MFLNMDNLWKEKLQHEINSTHFISMMKYLELEAKHGVNIYPSSDNYFKALLLTSFKNVKVVILGQDPYHAQGQAHGLSFSVPYGVKVPPSLQNIFNELNTDIDMPIPAHGCLERWALQGVLLLNSILSVEENKPLSHQHIGWQNFTDLIIKILSDECKDIVFLLWGQSAKQKIKLINTENHLVLTAPHPSPLSVYKGFYGCKHFSKTNAYLQSINKTPIDWRL